MFGSSEAERLDAEAAPLRAEYQALVNEARVRGLPAVPSFHDQVEP
jgi:F0F1-type ATP synthase membrane subunit b/b'